MNDGVGKFFLVDPLPLHRMTEAKHGQEQDQNKTDPGYSGKNPRFQLSEIEKGGTSLIVTLQCCLVVNHEP